MAQTCAICGAEINLLQQQKLADGNFICRKTCRAKGMKLFDYVSASLPQVQEHLAQVELGTKLWQTYFEPMLKAPKDQRPVNYCRGDLYILPSKGLVAVIENRYKFLIFGKSTIASVYRLGDLYEYDYREEQSTNSEGKVETKSYVRFIFRNVEGMSSFELEIFGQKSYEDMVKFLDKQFGIQKSLFNIGNNVKREINAVKSVIDAVQAAKNDDAGVQEKAEDAFDAMNAAKYGDRTGLWKLADEAIAAVK